MNGLIPKRKTCAADNTVIISPAKAKELSLSSKDVVAIIGRRRTASIANVSISKRAKSAGECIISKNLAKNLRIRDMDKIKVVPIGKDLDEEESERSGDLVLVNSKSRPPVAASITLSPIEDSLARLQSIELDGDEMDEEEIMERFVTPYLNLEEDSGKVMFKKGNVLSIADANGVFLDFKVNDIEIENEDAETKEDEDGKCIYILTIVLF